MAVNCSSGLCSISGNNQTQLGGNMASNNQMGYNSVNYQDKQPGFLDNTKNFFFGTPGQSKFLPKFNSGQEGIMQTLANLGLTGVNNNQQNLTRRLQPQAQIPNNALMQLLQQSLSGVQGFNNQQQQGVNQLFGNTLAGANTNGFDAIDANARKQFQQQGIPSLAERFTSLGGGQRSSAFQGALGGAQADLESQLGALRSQYGLQQQQQRQSLLGNLLQQGSKDQLLRQGLLGSLFGQQQSQQGQQFNQLGNLLGLGLRSPFEPLYVPRSPGIIESGLNAAAGSLGKMFGIG